MNPTVNFRGVLVGAATKLCEVSRGAWEIFEPDSQVSLLELCGIIFFLEIIFFLIR
jgi:hypothetical protein